MRLDIPEYYQKTYDEVTRVLPSDDKLVNLYHSIGTFTYIGLKPKYRGKNVVAYKIRRMWFGATKRREVDITFHVKYYLENEGKQITRNIIVDRDFLIFQVYHDVVNNGMCIY